VLWGPRKGGRPSPALGDVRPPGTTRFHGKRPPGPWPAARAFEHVIVEIQFARKKPGPRARGPGAGCCGRDHLVGAPGKKKNGSWNGGGPGIGTRSRREKKFTGCARAARRPASNRGRIGGKLCVGPPIRPNGGAPAGGSRPLNCFAHKTGAEQREKFPAGWVEGGLGERSPKPDPIQLGGFLEKDH